LFRSLFPFPPFLPPRRPPLHPMQAVMCGGGAAILNVQCWCVWADRDPSIHRFIQAGLGSSCAAIVLPVLGELERQKPPLRRKFTGSCFRVFQYTRRHPFFFNLSFLSRTFGRKGSSSSKEPQFILEDAIHASESSSRGVNDNPVHIFEVRKMDDPIVPPEVTAHGFIDYLGAF
jgi:hypothetical protein